MWCWGLVVNDELVVAPAVEDVVIHAKEVSLSEGGITGGAAETVHVEDAVLGPHD